MEELLRKTKFKAGKQNAVWRMPDSHLSFPLLPNGLSSIVTEEVGQLDWLMVFVESRSELESVAPKAIAALAKGGLVWFCFPKKSSKRKTDLNRDEGWDVIMGMGLKYVNLVSVDETWSAFGATVADEDYDEKLRQKSAGRATLLGQYMDHNTREMRYPDDLAAALRANEPENAFFLGLSFTNRKEYLESIVTAKRAETRQQRIQKTIAYLREGRKNPAGR